MNLKYTVSLYILHWINHWEIQYDNKYFLLGKKTKLALKWTSEGLLLYSYCEGVKGGNGNSSEQAGWVWLLTLT